MTIENNACFKQIQTILNKYRNCNDEQVLIQAQLEIEQVFINSKEQVSIFKKFPELNEKMENCKFTDYALNKLKKSKIGDKSILVNIISSLENDNVLISAVLVYTVSQLFYGVQFENSIKCAKLIESLSREIMYLLFQKQEDLKSVFDPSVLAEVEEEEMPTIKNKRGRHVLLQKIFRDADNPRYRYLGVLACEVLEKAKIIKYQSGNENIKNLLNSDLQSLTKLKKKLSEVHVICTIPLDEIPIKCNLPMICPPRDWQIISESTGNLKENDCYSFRLDGAYLNKSRFLSLLRFRFLSSKNNEDFRIRWVSWEMLNNISKLQRVGFYIDCHLLNYIKENEKLLVSEKLLTEPDRIEMDIKMVIDRIRDKDEHITETEVDKMRGELIQMRLFALWESWRLLLCRIYIGIKIYFPAFIDYRGRVYRSGLISLHEREMLRALTYFSWEYKVSSEDFLRCKEVLLRALGYLIKRCPDDEHAIKEAKSFLISEKDRKFDTTQILKSAAHPYLAVRIAIWLNEGQNLHLCPVSLDASSSAYQFLAYLTCNQEIAKYTNLIAHKSDERQDLYTIVGKHLEEYILKEKISIPKKISIKDITNRKLLKCAYMPMLYGKTMFALEEDIKSNDFLKNRVWSSEAHQIAKIFHDFGKIFFREQYLFMNFCQSLATLCVALDQSVYLDNKLLHIVQDYREYDIKKLTVYSNDKKGNKRISLNTRTEKRSSKKAKAGITANLVHSLDALVAQKVINKFFTRFPDAPLYTIHDCFITTPLYADYLPKIYIESLLELGSPVKLMNDYVINNLFRNFKSCKLEQQSHRAFTCEELKENFDLVYNIPETKMKAKKIKINFNLFVKSYEQYMELLNEKKVNSFIEKLQNYPSRYCIYF